jgi:hypothetical protein
MARAAPRCGRHPRRETRRRPTATLNAQCLGEVGGNHRRVSWQGCHQREEPPVKHQSPTTTSPSCRPPHRHSHPRRPMGGTRARGRRRRTAMRELAGLATLAAASGASLKALMARIGHARRRRPPVPARNRRPGRRHRPLPERFGEEPPVPSRAHDDTPETSVGGHAVGTPADSAEVTAEEEPPDQDFRGGDDGIRTHDPLLAKQVL